MLDITVKFQEMIEDLQKLGSENDYSLEITQEQKDKMQEILDNLFIK